MESPASSVRTLESPSSSPSPSPSRRVLRARRPSLKVPFKTLVSRAAHFHALAPSVWVNYVDPSPSAKLILSRVKEVHTPPGTHYKYLIHQSVYKEAPKPRSRKRAAQSRKARAKHVLVKKTKYVFTENDYAHLGVIRAQLADLVVREPFYQIAAAAIPDKQYKIPEFYSIGFRETSTSIDIIFRMEFVEGKHLSGPRLEKYKLLGDAHQWLESNGIHHNDLVEIDAFGSMNASNMLDAKGKYVILDFGNASNVKIAPRLG